MTVITKASDLLRKGDEPIIVDVERSNSRCQKGSCVWIYRLHCNFFLLLVSTLMAMVVMLAAASAVMLLNKTLEPPKSTAYSGFCRIPLDIRSQMIADTRNMLKMGFQPIRWQQEPLTVFATEEHAPQDDSIFEHVEIQDDLEKVSVVNDDGDNVQFIHDFAANASGIVDKSRCFVMPLNSETVMRPDVFVVNILRGAEFDVRRVNARLRARLPPLDRTLLPHAFAEACVDRPIYHLSANMENLLLKKKRSVDEKSARYTHFAGKSVLEVDVHNLEELEKYESKV